MLETHARKTDPTSSFIAARDNASRRQSQIHEVVSALIIFNGSTSAELAANSQIERYTVARRLPDAESKGLVKRGEPRKCAISGKCAVTWFVKE